uniref:Uncharacterized protein n=1 Tax=Panagrolaimus sp. PS1159 TaxID=55785 RepID=A0AC35F2S3_9BILA
MRFFNQYKPQLCDCTRYSENDDIRYNKDTSYKALVILSVLQLSVFLRVLFVENFTPYALIFPCNGTNIYSVEELKRERDERFYRKV